MDKPEILTTLGIKDTGRRRTKTKHSNHKKKLARWGTRTPSTSGVNPGTREG